MKKVLLYLEENLEEILMILLLIGMTVIMGVQVVSRYVFGMSLSWSEEATRYLFIWSAFLSVSLCTRKCISIKIDQFIKFFPRRGEAVFKMLNLAVSLAFFLFLIPYAWKYLQATIASGQVSPAMGIPMYYVQSAPLVSFVLCAIRIVQRFIVNFRIALGKDEHRMKEGSLASEVIEANVDEKEYASEMKHASRAQKRRKGR